jgi:DNA-binding transcriptional regulator LsrR (DeoR family)
MSSQARLCVRQSLNNRGAHQQIHALIRKLHGMGLSQREIGRQLGVTRYYVRRAMGFVCM